MRLLMGIAIGVALGVVFHRQIREQCRQCLDYLNAAEQPEGEGAGEVR